MGSKLVLSAKRIPKKTKAILQMVLAIIGALITIAEIAEIAGINQLKEIYTKYFWQGIGIVILVSIALNWDRLNYKMKIADSPDIVISLRVCDALKNDGAVIIPTNTTFDTSMDDEFISKYSLQGQFQTKYFRDKLSILDQKIEEGLYDKKPIILKDERKTKKNRYPIGTVCRISERNKRAYLLADSDINEKGIPINVEACNIAKALVNLWDSLAIIGNQETYSVPLVGTGKARVRDASRDEIVRTIILTFLAATKEHKITEHLIICIHPSDFEKIHWEELCDFLNYQSQYANHKPITNVQNGSAENTPRDIRFAQEQSEHEPEYHYNSIPQKEETLSETERMVVALLKGNEMSKSAIAEAMGLTMASTTRIVKKLNEGGIIESKVLGNKRVYYKRQ